MPPDPADRIHSWHLFPVRLKLEELSIDRNRFIEEIRRRGVGCSVHWRPLHLHPYYEETFGWRPEHLPVASLRVDENRQPAAVSGDDRRRAAARGPRSPRDKFRALSPEVTHITGVRAATRDDVRDVARIHKARFGGPEYTLGQYSLPLISSFYLSFLGRCLFLVHVSQRGVDGFVVGGNHEEVYAAQRAFVRNHLARCCAETLLHPGLWRAAYHFCRRSFLPQPTKLVAMMAPKLPKLLSLAVDEAVEGSGTALALVKAFESNICSRHSGYTLSVLKNNPRAVRFYQRLGMQIVVDAFPRSFVFQKDFAPPDEGPPQGPLESAKKSRVAFRSAKLALLSRSERRLCDSY